MCVRVCVCEQIVLMKLKFYESNLLQTCMKLFVLKININSTFPFLATLCTVLSIINYFDYPNLLS